VIRKWYNKTRSTWRAYSRALSAVAFDSQSLDELQDFYLGRNAKEDLTKLQKAVWAKEEELRTIKRRVKNKECELHELLFTIEAASRA